MITFLFKRVARCSYTFLGGNEPKKKNHKALIDYAGKSYFGLLKAQWPVVSCELYDIKGDCATLAFCCRTITWQHSDSQCVEQIEKRKHLPKASPKADVYQNHANFHSSNCVRGFVTSGMKSRNSCCNQLSDRTENQQFICILTTAGGSHLNVSKGVSLSVCAVLQVTQLFCIIAFLIFHLVEQP